jgi:hypothetical protein
MDADAIMFKRSCWRAWRCFLMPIASYKSTIVSQFFSREVVLKGKRLLKLSMTKELKRVVELRVLVHIHPPSFPALPLVNERGALAAVRSQMDYYINAPILRPFRTCYLGSMALRGPLGGRALGLLAM